MSDKKLQSTPIGINQKTDSKFITFSESVGGSVYGTTPGGTRIKYDRKDLLQFRFSPYSKTPPVNLPIIEGVTKKSIESESPIIKVTEKVFEKETIKEDEKEEKEEDGNFFLLIFKIQCFKWTNKTFFVNS